MRLYTLLKNIITSVTPVSKGGTGATNKTDIINNLKLSLTNLLYPIGSIYISIENISPEEKFGGTWQQLEDKFLLGAGNTYAAGATGGSATHKLTTAEMPSHTHTFTGKSSTSNSTGAHTHNVYGYYGGGGGSYSGIQWWKLYKSSANYSVVNSAGAHTHTVTAKGSNSSTGGGTAHNNMPPYLVVYMWERIA